MSDSQILSERHSSGLNPLQINQPKPRLDPVGALLIVLSAIGFSTLAIFGKLAYAHDLDPLVALSWRLGGATLFLWVWLFYKRQWQVSYRGAISAFCLGAFGYAAQSLLFFNALAHASAGLTVLMFYTYPAFVAILSWIVIRKPMQTWQAQALSLALLGSILTVNLDGQAASPTGIALGIAAGAGYAIYMLLGARLVRNILPLSAAAWMLLGATFSIVGWSTLQQGVVMPMTPGAIIAVAGLAVISTAIPIVCLFSGLRRLDVVPAAILSTLEPVLAVVMGIVLLGEHLWSGQILGGGLIVASALMLHAKPGS